MRKLVAALVAAPVLAGCVSQPEPLTKYYTPPEKYQAFTCDQLVEEARIISYRLERTTGERTRQQRRGAVVTAAGVVFFWPILYVGAGTVNIEPGEIRRIQGEMEAVEEMARRKSCPIEFRQASAG